MPLRVADKAKLLTSNAEHPKGLYRRVLFPNLQDVPAWQAQMNRFKGPTPVCSRVYNIVHQRKIRAGRFRICHMTTRSYQRLLKHLK